LISGDFLDIYSKQPNEWNCIVTCFFIDTAKNIFEYIETIWNALDKDGIWINFGPLLYHYSDFPGEFSIELSYDELREVIQSSGFEIVKESLKQSTYASNVKSMLQMVYRNVFFVAKKKKLTPSPEKKKFKMDQ
jgi:carnosine N-methyltransferase